MLTGPLRDRFQIREHLDFYSLSDLTEIIVRNAKKLAIEITDEAATEIAVRSRSTPRIVEPFLLRSELILRTPRGRVATPKAFEHMNFEPPVSGDGQIGLFDNH